MDDDIFEQLHHLEDEAISRGREEGIRDGLLAGLNDGRELGVQKGYDIGIEIGFYAGCVNMWRQLQKLHPNAIPQKAEKGIVALEELLAIYPLSNPQDERLQDLLERVQGRFKAVASSLGLLQDYFPRESPATLQF